MPSPPCPTNEPDWIARGLTIGGATTLALGAGSFAGLAATLASAHRRVGALNELKDAAIANGGATDEMNTRARELHGQAKSLKTVAVALGVLGGASVITGITMVALGQRRITETRYAFAPAISPGFAGVGITGRF